MKINLLRPNNTTITLDVAKIDAISGIVDGKFELYAGSLTYTINSSEYTRVSNVLGTASSGGGSEESGGMEVVYTTERDLTLEPNKYYIFGECSTLNINIGEPTTGGKLNEYRFEFDSGATPTVLTLPNTVNPSTLNILEDTKYVISIKNNVLVEAGTAYDNSLALLRNLINRTITKVVIPNECSLVPQYMFLNCTSLTDVTLPATLNNIELYAFNGCTALLTITLPEDLTLLGAYAFLGCSNLKSIVIPDGITVINSNTFYRCSALTSVTFPEDLTIINSNCAFSLCSSLREVNFPDSLTYIGGRAFEYCYALTEINLPDNVSFIGDYAFQSCTNVTSITLPDNLTAINLVAFADCRSVTPTIILPSHLSVIGVSAFVRCYGLRYIEIPQSVGTISNTAFLNCTGLREITMYDGIATIGTSNAFQGIAANARVRIIGTSRVIPFLSGCPATTLFYVDPTMVQAYKTNSAWSARASYIYSLNDYIE